MRSIIDKFLHGTGPMPSDNIILQNQDYIEWLISNQNLHQHLNDHHAQRRFMTLYARMIELQRPQRKPQPVRHHDYDHSPSTEFRFKKSKKKSTRKRRSIKKRKSKSKK